MAEPTPLSPEYRRWRINIIAATWLSYVGYYFCRKVFGIVKKDLSDDYGFTDPELAHIWTAYLVAYMVGQFISAGVGRKLTCRRLLLIGMATSMIVTAVVGAVTRQGHEAFAALMGFMALNGVAQATGWPGNVGLLSKWTRRHERGTLMAIWGTCYQIGSILAKHFAAFMLALAGIAWSFWGASMVFLGIWLFFLWKGQDRPENVGLPPLVEEVDPTQDSDGAATPAADGSVLPQSQVMRVVISMGLIYFCFKFIRYALDSWGPMILAEQFQLPVIVLTEHFLATSTRDQVERYLAQRSLINVSPSVRLATFMPVDCSLTVRLRDNANPIAVREAAQEWVHRYLDPYDGGLDGNGWPFGGTLFAADFARLLSDVLEVRHVSSVQLYDRSDAVDRPGRLRPGWEEGDGTQELVLKTQDLFHCQRVRIQFEERVQ